MASCLDATSLYETKLLKATLEQLVDFDRINSGEMRFSIGAVNVRTGNLVRFDNATRTMARHVGSRTSAHCSLLGVPSIDKHTHRL